MDTNKDEKSEIIRRIVRENKAGLTPEELESQEEAMINIFERNMLPADALGFSEDFLKYVYKFAYTLYQQNKIEEASQLFRWLKVMVPFYPKYTKALIQCFILQKKWGPAITYLLELAYQDFEDPMPFAKISECLMEAEDYAGALIATEKAIQRAGDKKQYAHKKEQWLMNYDYILSQLKIDPKILEKVHREQSSPNINQSMVKE